MDNFIWREIFSVNVELFDNQHKQLFEIGKKLYFSIMDSSTNENIETIIQDLCNYSKYHFEEEEYYLKKYNIENLDEHLSKHDLFRSEVEKFSKEFQEGKKFIPMKIINFLQDWLMDHILEYDKSYSDLLKDKEIRSITDSPVTAADCN